MPDDTNVQRAVGSFEVLVDLIAPDNTYETLSSTVYFTNVSTKRRKSSASDDKI